MLKLALVQQPYGTFFQLNDQVLLRGYGNLNADQNAFETALDNGVRLFDGALAYGTDPIFAQAWTAKQKPDVVFCSKIPSSRLDPHRLAASAERCFDEILKDIGRVSIEVLYLHGPDCIQPEILDAMQTWKHDKRVQFLGLSNVDVTTVETVLSAGYPIDVIQNEWNPYFYDEELLALCKKLGIVFIGYRPFGKSEHNKLFADPILNQISKSKEDSVQAVILQWMNQKGITPIPHSLQDAHIGSNQRLPPWTLTADEMESIDHIRIGKQSTCNWKKNLSTDLLQRSQTWLNKHTKKGIP